MLTCRTHGETRSCGELPLLLNVSPVFTFYYSSFCKEKKMWVLKWQLFDSLYEVCSLTLSAVWCCIYQKCGLILLKSRNIAHGVVDVLENSLFGRGKIAKLLWNSCLIFLLNVSSWLFGCRGLWQAPVTAPSRKGQVTQRWGLFTLHLGLKGWWCAELRPFQKAEDKVSLGVCMNMK